jgi:Asp-tRNA(Asn)/Glu-tRNA(Gln) amidotransferase A subunit family amidase
MTKFGQNVKRRVVLGNYLMQSGTGISEMTSNLVEAQKFRKMVIEQYSREMITHDIDFVISPTGFGETPPKVEDILNPKDDQDKSPVYEYKMDYFTVISNCLGTLNMTVPLFESEDAPKKYKNFPGSVRLMGFFGEDYHMIRIGQRIEKVLDMAGMSSFKNY